MQVTKAELKELCDKENGSYIESGSLYECYLPREKDAYYECCVGENCIIVFARPPVEQRPDVVLPTRAAP